MKTRNRIVPLATSVLALFASTAIAECNCQDGGIRHSPATVPMVPQPDPMSAAPLSTGPMVLNTLPPPGSLGRTYTLRSRPISHKMHPRIGVVEIHGWNHMEHVSAVGLNAYRNRDGNWVLESEDPLIPWVPHIFTIEARHAKRKRDPCDARMLRLIPGRAIEVDF